MTSEYPYMVSNNKIAPIIEKVRSASKPSKFTNQFLTHLGFTSSNDRAIIPLLKKLDFLTDDGTPTSNYDRLRDANDYKFVLAERIKDFYSDLYTINTEIHRASDTEIKGAISRVTGKDETNVNRFFSTFKTLCGIADFNNSKHITPEIKSVTEHSFEGTLRNNEIPNDNNNTPNPTQSTPQFHYNIQIHLPPTTDISVYNAIFKSLKENLLI